MNSNEPFEIERYEEDEYDEDRGSESARGNESGTSGERELDHLESGLGSDNTIDLVWKAVVVSANGVELLHSVSGVINRGLVAIMGPSGAGKTTLLNCLACRLGSEFEQKGEIRINGEPRKQSKIKRLIGYVMQDDEHNPLLTVRETLEFVAMVRLGNRLSKAEQATRIDALLDQMSLRHCADVLVGTGNSGIAPGEKKRLSVALELLSLPKMLFLDEPTSNLDSLDALQFVQSLRRLVSETNCVVVCTIHQPQYKVLCQFDRLILLRSGSIIYDAATEEVSEYCYKIGKPCPFDVNPADHLMAAIALPSGLSFNSQVKENIALASYVGLTRREVDVERGKGRGVGQVREAPPFQLLFRMSFRRAFALLDRRRWEWLMNLILNLTNAILVGTVFLQIGEAPESARKRLSALFFCVVNQATFGAISTVQLFPAERTVVLRLRSAGNLSALPYFLGMASAEMLSKTPFPIIFCLIVYWLIGFQNTAAHFFGFLIAVLVSFWTGMTVAMAVSTVSRHSSIASIALPLLMELSRLFAGYFSPPSQTAAGLSWINYLSYYFYPFLAAAHNEMNDLTLHCGPGVNATGACKPVWAGQELVDRGLDELRFGQCIGIEFAYLSGCVIISYLAIRFIKS
jgi:ATP-binding cassette subfamily G (WHITE) protein 2